MFVRERAPGLWIPGSVVDPLEFEHFDRDKSRALDGHAGGTYSLLGALNLGGEGLTLSGSKHQIVGTLTTASGGVVLVASGGRIRANGVGSGDTGKIDLKVVAGVALLDVEDGAALRIKDGGSLDVFGTLTAKLGSVSQWQSGSTASFKEDSSLTMEEGSALVLAEGAGMSVGGQIALSPTGSVTLQGGATILALASAIFTWQGTVNLSSLNLVGSETWPKLSTARTVTRPAVRAIPLTFNDGANTVGPDDPDMWECRSSLSAAPAFRSRSATAAGKSSILEVLDLPIGAIITGAKIDARGTEPTSIASTLPTYQVVSWSSGEGGLVSHSGATADAGLALNFGLVTASTTVGNTGDAESRTVVAGRRYGILVTHPYQSSVGQGAEVYKANILASVGSMQV